MKRYRAADVPPKFRRTVKGRSTRLGESVYFNRFFSTYNLVYLKFFLMWVCCITLDFLIGFRFELLWPVWLLVRHLYESFRVHAFSSSLHYSAFSVFFVCVTATSDLVCYLFIPIQVLIFLASTYVWVQFVYQSSDRGICLPSLFLWALFIIFEYSVRYRFDNATWYLARTSWITAGLFPSTADSVSVGAPPSSTPSASSPRLELYRPFAAHCIGFPVVTLGFRVKSLFSNWRMRIRREEVRRQNEFYERILADAIPTSFENRKHYISSRSHLSMEQQEALDYDTGGGGYTTAELLNGLDVNGQPLRLYGNSTSAMGNNSNSTAAFGATGGPGLAAICAAPNTTQTSNGGISAASAAAAFGTSNSTAQQPPLALLKKQQRLMTKQGTSSGSLKQHAQQNGSTTPGAKRNGTLSVGGKCWRPDGTGTAASMFGKGGNKQMATLHSSGRSNGGHQALLSRDETIVHKFCRTAFRFCCLFVLSTFGQLLSALLSPSFQQTLDGLLAQFRSGGATTAAAQQQQSQDDLISSSGDGSNIAEEDDWERESISNNNNSSNNTLHGGNFSAAGHSDLLYGINMGGAGGGGKRKSRRPRGLSTLSQASTAAAATTTGNQQDSSSTSKTTTTGSSNSTNSIGTPTTARAETGVDELTTTSTTATTIHSEAAETGSGAGGGDVIKHGELKHLQKEKQSLELSLDKMRADLRQTRTAESELRAQLALAQQQEQSCRAEWKQFEREQKQRQEQLETKCRQLGKQNDHFRTNIQALEKRVGELQLKKLEVDRELANERLVKQQQLQSDSSRQATLENGEQFKQKLNNMDRELKQLKREAKTKDETCSKLEEEIRQLRSNTSNEGKLVEQLRQKNFLLEQTLSAENRLKQDLFRALNDSKAEIASIKAQLRAKQSKDQSDMMSAFSAGNSLFSNAAGGGASAGGGSSTGSSPTQQHQQQQQHFPSTPSLSQQQQQKSLTPPPLSVGNSTFNLEQLLQATQNMSYSLGPIDSNGGTGGQQGDNSYAYGNGGGGPSSSSSSPYIGSEASEMLLAVGGHRGTTGGGSSGGGSKGGGN